MFIGLWHNNIAVKAGSTDFDQLSSLIDAATMVLMHMFTGEESWIILSYTYRFHCYNTKLYK